MATDPTIRNLFQSGDGDDTSGAKLDASAIIRRSKARRFPRQLGAGSVVTLALVGIVVASVQGIGSLNNAPMSTMADGAAPETSGMMQSGPEGGLVGPAAPNSIDGSTSSKRAPAEQINLCGGALADIAPSQTGLELTVDFGDSVRLGKMAGGQTIEGTATLTNTGDETQVGYTNANPAITLSQDGIVLWHSNGAMIAMAVEVNLAPDESIEYPVTFVPVICGVDDDFAELGFSTDLPVVEPGKYQLSALVDFMGEFDAELVTGPLADITIK